MAAEPTTAPSTNGASPAAAPDTMSPADAFSRLEAAGIDELDDEPYEDLSDLGIGEPGEEGDDAEASAEGAEKPEVEEPKDEDAEKPKPEDALGLKGKGTREQPLRHKDLPADKFVKLKAPDGSEVVVSLKDAVSGTFMSRAMVDRHVSEAKNAEERAKGIAEKAIDHMKRSNERLAATLRSPQGLVEALVETDEGMRVLVEAARATARMIKNPQLRANVVAELRAKRVAAQEQQLAQQRQALQQQQQEAAEQAQLQQTLAPAYKQGLKEAGILRKEQLTDELRDGIKMRFDHLTQKHQRTPTGAELKMCIRSAVEELKAKGKLAAPARPRAAPPVPETTARPSNGKKDWSKVPEAQRMRDPAFLFDKAARKSVQRGA
jgi:hypothetical protein